MGITGEALTLVAVCSAAGRRGGRMDYNDGKEMEQCIKALWIGLKLFMRQTFGVYVGRAVINPP